MTCAIISKSSVNVGTFNEYEPPYSKIKEQLRDTIWELYCSGYTEFYFSAPRDSALVNYHEEQYLGLYKLAGKACVKGRVRFDGFNGRYVYWCHNYNEDTGKWSEHEGRIVYSGIDVADGEEFLNDGYNELKLPRVSREIRQRLAK